MAARIIFLSLFAFVTLDGALGQTSSCQDIDTTACVLLQKQQPDLCANAAFASVSGVACKRFCGRCPLMCYSCPSPVLASDDCNTTISCAVNQTCMTKHLRASDGHHEYLMSCENKQICNGLGFGFLFGKRDIESRDVSIECCDTDFCNMPSRTTTTTTTTPVPTTGLYVHGCAKDIVFVLDDSGSVGQTNFGKSKDFVRQLITALDVGPHTAQVATVAFSTHPTVAWYLNTYQSKADAHNAVNSIRYQGGVTRTGEALELVRTSILTQNRGDRPSVRNVVIVLTDGQSSDKLDTMQQASALHGVSDDVISIVVGSGIDTTELTAIATDTHHVIDVRGYTDLSGIVPQLLKLICA